MFPRKEQGRPGKGGLAGGIASMHLRDEMGESVDHVVGMKPIRENEETQLAATDEGAQGTHAHGNF